VRRKRECIHDNVCQHARARRVFKEHNHKPGRKREGKRRPQEYREGAVVQDARTGGRKLSAQGSCSRRRRAEGLARALDWGRDNEEEVVAHSVSW